MFGFCERIFDFMEFSLDKNKFSLDKKEFFFDLKVGMVATIRPLWYLPHERYGSYHNVVLQNWVILIRNNELISLYGSIPKSV